MKEVTTVILKLLRPVVLKETDEDVKDAKKKAHRFFGQAHKNSALPGARSFLDYDYLNKLSKEEREWLGKFSGEYYLNNFMKKPLHRTKKLRLSVWNKNNGSRRTVEAGDCAPLPVGEDLGTPSPEDAMIERAALANCSDDSIEQMLKYRNSPKKS